MTLPELVCFLFGHVPPSLRRWPLLHLCPRCGRKAALA